MMMMFFYNLNIGTPFHANYENMKFGRSIRSCRRATLPAPAPRVSNICLQVLLVGTTDTYKSTLSHANFQKTLGFRHLIYVVLWWAFPCSQTIWIARLNRNCSYLAINCKSHELSFEF